MSDALYAAVSGAVAQEKALEIVANNIANVSTTGFKGARLSFKEVMSEAARGHEQAGDKQVVVDKVYTDFTPGTLHTTNNPLDVALIGPGFFAIETPQGERYTRAGSFTLAQDGTLVTTEGQPVVGPSGAIRLDPLKTAAIDDQGRIWSGDLQVGQLKVVDFSDRDALVREGLGFWKAQDNTAQVVQNVQLQSKALEQSNVNAVTGMTQLIWISRAHEMFHRAMDAVRAVDQKTTNELTV